MEALRALPFHYLSASNRPGIEPGLLGHEPNTVTHCSIFDKKVSNPMNAHEHFIRIGYYLAQIDKIINVLSHTCTAEFI